MTQNRHPELDGQEPRLLYTFELKRPGQTLRERLRWSLIGLSTGLGLAAGLFFLVSPQRSQAWFSWLPSWPSAQDSAAADDPFKQGAHLAMKAAELTQTAEFKEEWVEVSLLWQQASAQMKAVPKNHPNHDLAQQKVGEYDRNLQYAQSNVNSRQARTPATQNYWTVGSDRDWVIAIQGIPTQAMRYASLCNEVLHYGNSIIELENGYVKQYENLDGNLKVLVDVPVALSTQGTPNTWSLGSAKEDVLRLQGSPTQMDKFLSDRFVTYYYGDSSILLEDGYVVSYRNVNQDLKVAMTLAQPPSSASPEVWSLGASRAEVLKVQKETPTEVSRDDPNCEETYYFKNSEVSLRQGFVIGYNNADQNLRVR